MTDYLPRELGRALQRAMRTLPVVVLSGLRQTGKSTLLQKEAAFAKGHRYRTLDDFATLAAARMEAADDTSTFVSPLRRLVIGPEDGAVGRTGGAKQGRLGLGQQCRVAEGDQLFRGAGAEPLTQPRGP